VSWGKRKPALSWIDLAFVGTEIGGILRVPMVKGRSDRLLPVSGSLERLPDTRLANRAEEMPPLSKERKQVIDTAAKEAGARNVAKRFAKHVHKSGDAELPYRLYTPSADLSRGPYPLVVFLHGAGGRGTDNEKHLTAWPKIWGTEFVQKTHPCYVLVPHASSGWGDLPKGGKEGQVTHGQMVMQVVKKLKQDHVIDPARIYVTGLSMGGFGTCYMLSEFPGVFAAGVPVCGADPRRAKAIGRTPLWIFHGNADVTVHVGVSRDLVKALRKLGRDPLYTEYDGVGHGCYKWTYTDPAMVEWLFSQRLGR
jgi:predicted peptidase